MSFQCEVYGKWILAGEHAVLRGSAALVFPLKAKSLQLSYQALPHPLTANFLGTRGEELRLLFWGVWERALELVGHTHAEVDGEFTLTSTLPVGAGMGASASLCVAVSRWLQWRGWIQTDDVYEFSRRLEDLFHGESSGVDIAVAMAGQPLHFERNGLRHVLEPRWQPRWYLSYSGSRGVTAECVNQVKEWIRENPEAGQATDALMSESVQMCERALQQERSEGFPTLIRAIQQTRICFERWGLTRGDVDRHMHFLENAGALAVKPTGSGNGGYVLSVWQSEPPVELQSHLVPLFSH
jgi:mevalonate kinase